MTAQFTRTKLLWPRACGAANLAALLGPTFRCTRANIFISSPNLSQICRVICLLCVCLMNALIIRKTLANLWWVPLSPSQNLGAVAASMTNMRLSPCPKTWIILNPFWPMPSIVCRSSKRRVFNCSLMAPKASRLIIAIILAKHLK